MGEKPVEPSLDRLLQELNHFKDMNYNKRLSILGLQLYAEHYVNEIVMEQLKESAKKEVRKYLTFPQKLRILKRMKVLNENKKNILEILNNLRDSFIHELILSKKEINNKLQGKKLGFQYSWILNEENGKFIESQNINLENYYEGKIKDKFTQLTISSIILIGELYYSLMKLRGKKCKELIKIDFKEKEKDIWEAVLMIYKLPQNE